MAIRWRTDGGERGQAAVETLYSMPIFLILFVIGFELFGITWNAQYAHVTSRYNTIHAADHQPCGSNHDQAGELSNPDSPSDTSMLSGDQSPYMQTFAKQRNMTNTGHIVCK